MYPKTIEEFKELVATIEATPGYTKPLAFATGTAIMCGEYPIFIQHFAVNVRENFGTAAILAHITGYTCGNETFQLAEQDVLEALRYFAPFTNDGKVHANIEALNRIADFLSATTAATGFVSFASALDGDINTWYKAFNYAFCFRLAAQGIITLEPHVLSDFAEKMRNVGYLIK